MDPSFINKLSDLPSHNSPAARVEGLARSHSADDPRQRAKVAQEFASFLYLEVMKAMRAALPHDGLGDQSSHAHEMYTSMMDAEIARLVAKRDATGLAKSIERSLQRMPGATPAPPKDVMPAPHSSIAGKIMSRVPTEGVVSSLYGVRADPFNGHEKFHHGVDIAASLGTPVKSMAAGTVTFSGHVAGYGNLVEIDHGNGLVTRYGHNAANLVGAGDRVRAGQPVAKVGNSGRATGAHLHFEVRKNGRAINPEIFLGEFSKGSLLRSII